MPSQETTNATTSHDIEALKKDLHSLEQHVAALERDRDNALRWGIIALGSAVMGMGAWIFNYITGHLK